MIIKMKMMNQIYQQEQNIFNKDNVKINDLKDQIQTKTTKFEKLKKERQDFKADCQKKINDII